MSIFVNENGTLVRKDAAEASQLIAVDTDNILGGGAGAQTNNQAMFDELSDRAIALNSSLTDQQGEIDALFDNGAVNHCNCVMATTTLYGVTATKGTTDNGGVKYTITRTTQTQAAQFLLCDEVALLAFFQKHTGEKFRLSGCPTGGDYSNGYSLAIFFNFDGTTIAYTDVGTGVEVTVPSVVTTARIAITIRTAATLNNTVFTPMLAPAAYTGDFVPYAMTNSELTEKAMFITAGTITELVDRMQDGTIKLVSASNQTLINALTNNAVTSTTLKFVAWRSGNIIDWFGIAGASYFIMGRVTNGAYTSHVIIKQP